MKHRPIYVAASIALISLSSAVTLIQLLYSYYAPMVAWLLLGAR